MRTRQFKTMTAAAVFGALVVAGMLIDSKSVQAANDNIASQDEKRQVANNIIGSEDEKQMIRIGLAVATSSGIHLNMSSSRRQPSTF